MRLIQFIFVAVVAMAAVHAATAPARAAEVPTLQPGDHILGKKTAPITIFEYASLTCPHCAAFETDTLPKLEKDWISSGKARLIYRDFPLDQSAVVAATVARCFPEDRYFPFVETLFESQREWAYDNQVATKAALARIARLGGMSQEQFDACVANQKIADAVLNSRLVAQKQYGVDSTPTFFINGTKVVGDLPYNEFVKHLNAQSGEAAPGGKGR